MVPSVSRAKIQRLLARSRSQYPEYTDAEEAARGIDFFRVDAASPGPSRGISGEVQKNFLDLFVHWSLSLIYGICHVLDARKKDKEKMILKTKWLLRELQE